jgi:hypothetical protein
MKTTLFTIPRFLSPTECRAIIAESERAGFEPAPVTTNRGFKMMPDIRNNTRLIRDDVPLAAHLWSRLECHLASDANDASQDDERAGSERTGEMWAPIGLNERFRLYRYERGQAFRWHRDGAFVRVNGERSHLTFMVYLNGGFDGGATEFEDTSVVPEEGLAVVFSHLLRHQGAEVTSGMKYVLRSDVMFRNAAA